MKLSKNMGLTNEVMDLAFDSMHQILNDRKFTQKQKKPYFTRISCMLVNLRGEFSKQDGGDIPGLETLVEQRVKEVIDEVDEEESRRPEEPPLPTEDNKRITPAPSPRRLSDDPISIRGRHPEKIPSWVSRG